MVAVTKKASKPAPANDDDAPAQAVEGEPASATQAAGDAGDS
jgi:hypothetical protein